MFCIYVHLKDVFKTWNPAEILSQLENPTHLESRKNPRTKFFDIEKPFSGIPLCFLVVFYKTHRYQCNCYMSICYYTDSAGSNLANIFLQHLVQQCYTSTPFF